MWSGAGAWREFGEWRRGVAPAWSGVPRPNLATTRPYFASNPHMRTVSAAMPSTASSWSSE